MISDKPKIAEGHQAIMPYLIVDGAEKLIHFLKTVFGAEERLRVLRPDGSIMHGEMAHAGCTIMLADNTKDYPPSPGGIFIYVKDTDATYQKALEAGAEKILEPNKPDYADRAAGVLDPFGNIWWLTTVK